MSAHPHAPSGTTAATLKLEYSLTTAASKLPTNWAAGAGDGVCSAAEDARLFDEREVDGQYEALEAGEYEHRHEAQSRGGDEGGTMEQRPPPGAELRPCAVACGGCARAVVSGDRNDGLRDEESDQCRKQGRGGRDPQHGGVVEEHLECSRGGGSDEDDDGAEALAHAAQSRGAKLGRAVDPRTNRKVKSSPFFSPPCERSARLRNLFKVGSRRWRNDWPN